MGKIGKQRCSLKWPCDTSDATWKEVTPTSSLHLVMGLKICNDARLITSLCLRNKFTFSRKQSTTSHHLDFLYIRNDLFSICSIRWPWNGAKNKWAIVPNWIQWWLTNWCHRNTLMADTQRSHYRSNVYVIISDSGPYTHTHIHCDSMSLQRAHTTTANLRQNIPKISLCHLVLRNGSI